MKTLRILLCWMLVCFLPLSAAGAASPVLGSSTGAMSPNRTTQSYGAQLQETALGCYVADSLRAGTGAQLSIICGGLLVQSLPGGTITSDDVKAVFQQDQPVLVVTIQAEALFQLLEQAVSYAQLGEDELLDPDSSAEQFPQISGFSFVFDVSQLPGRRVREITLEDGSPLERTDTRSFTLAVPRNMTDGTLGFSVLEGAAGTAAGTLSELLSSYVQGQGQVIIPETGRITMLGSAGQTLFEQFHMGAQLPYVLLLILLIRLPWRRRRQQASGYNYPFGK
ncbi:5'-nucleotidase C-terminal domain-containing protein [Flavonifractor sp. An306]|uniref:5'-nucleotidase C-terminal domain-containing protein n=1 Tax=Flavonifractor sp. An306 TaxID=1965629 RepID=UPI00174B6B54|nr:5'-nucleotidase [Flavonifractor sp. An306]